MIRVLNVGIADRQQLAARLRELAERLGAPLELRPTDELRFSHKKAKAEEAAYAQIFNYWQRATGRMKAKQAAKDRRRAVIARLRNGYTVTDILRAIDGCVSSEWHMKEGRNDLTLICQSEAKLEGFAERADDRPQLAVDAGDAGRDAELTKLEDDAMEALQQGNMERYEQIQARIRKRGRNEDE